MPATDVTALGVDRRGEIFAFLTSADGLLNEGAFSAFEDFVIVAALTTETAWRIVYFIRVIDGSHFTYFTNKINYFILFFEDGGFFSLYAKILYH